MKKITAFFLALFPLIVIVLLFVSGMLVKDYTHVFVTAVEFDRDSLIEKCPNNTPYPTNKDGNPVVEQLYAHVLPFNATEPTIYYMSTNEDVATIDDNGLLTVKDFGETDIIAISKENKNITATCPVKVTDDKIHRIEITNAPKHNCYVGQNETMQLNANAIPYDDLAETIDPTVNFIAPATNVLDVTTDGLLIAHDESTEESTPIEVTYCVEEQEGQPEIRDSVNVNVGPGVTAIEFENPDEFTTKDRFDLFDEMKIFPEDSESGRIKSSDFKYVSTKPEIATIDENGKVQFLKPGECEFNITYVYKPSLTLKKKITSTCQNAADVAFNCYSFTDKYENYTGGDPYIDEKNIN
ncbi:MAG: Ig-like domain-containing protein [Mycoplasmoidaceae bacterium]|nr:Ig-like domain-containing protein [Mycoplasmoidaceae bacterium]